MSPDDYSILVDVYGYGHLHGIPACHVANKRDREWPRPANCSVPSFDGLNLR